MKSLHQDVSALSELAILLIIVAVIVVIVLVAAGGIILTVGIFFGGKLGLGFGLLVLGGLLFIALLIPQLHVPKQAIYGVYLLGGLGLLFLVFGALGV